MSNVDVVRNELLRLGYSPVQVAGLVGRFQQESYHDLRTTAAGDAGMSHGIGQWNGDRLKALQSFAADPANGGLSWSDPVLQARFADHELRGSESGAGNLLRSATTIEDAAKAAAAYERPQGFSMAHPENASGWMNGLNNARKLLGMPVDTTAVASATPSAVGPMMTPTGAPGTTLTSNPIVAAANAAAPVAPPTPAAPVLSPLQVGQQQGVGAGIKAALGNDKVTGGLSAIAGAFGGGSGKSSGGGGQGSQFAPAQPSSIGADQQGATIAQGASQIMASLLAKKRGAMGLTLSG